MSKSIIDRHAGEWEDYMHAYEKTRNQLEADELLIQKHFGFKGGNNLPAEWREMIDRRREEWADEWGIKGWRSKQLKDRQAEEIKVNYRDSLHVEVPPQAPGVNADIPASDLSPYSEKELARYYAEQRDAAKERLSGELNAIEETYKEWGIPVPEATKKRMAIRAMVFKQRWDGIEPEMPLNQIKILTDKDHLNHFQSFRDLAKSHNIIQAHYGHPDNMPYDTRKELVREMDEFHDEIDTYNAERKQQRGEFKTRLETIRNQQQSNTPKLR